MKQNPSYRQIAELFGAPVPQDDRPMLGSRSREGATAEESEELGSQSLSEGDYERAIHHFKAAVGQRDPSDIHARVELGAAYEYADLAPQAMRQYERALRVKADEPEPHIGLSQIYKRYARYRDSLAELERAIALQPGNAFYHFKLAELLREMGERKKSVTAAQGAIAAAPDQSFYHYWVGDLLIELRRFDEALDALRAAIELSPGDDFLYLRAAVAFWGAEKPAEAVRAIRLASELDPDKDLYHGLLQEFLYASGDDEAAEREDERVDRMDAYDHEQLKRIRLECGL